ncbi:nucleotide-binding protein [Pseudarthrobacter sp. MDT3-28]|uniref:TIR domain-containing protein n=1 Tax=Pseudarthrobacter raffinosi TaxID=2953651 RepID=UPI00208E33D7|nr:TIR domain-containing protein [Pseudarthrobacter sp. MDT3-28]MCO4239738.1 nucleotide-binding protein [Pseudarthrobacter sp. MDT3-28]
MSLPIKTTLDDVRAVVSYLKTKPAGATVLEAKAVVDNKILDTRKLKAYQTWDLVSMDNDRFKLTEKGRRLARGSVEEPTVFREVVNAVPAYRNSIEWAFHQGFTELTVDDLAANWHEHHLDSVGSEHEATLKGAVTCFFSVASGAGLGAYKLGRGGGTTRLELDSEAVKALVEEGPSAPPWEDPTADMDEVSVSDLDGDEDGTVGGGSNAGSEVAQSNQMTATTAAPRQQDEYADELRVFISHGKNMEVVDQVKTVLEMADIKAEVAVESESAAIPVPDKVFGAMRNCNAGIICVSGEASSDDPQSFTLNQNVLIEIGAAFVLYDKRVVLLWDKRVPVPSNLQGLYRCEFEGNELSWPSGMKLMKAILGFKKK